MIGERLLNLRKDAELTQDELAATLNINKHSISSYERDKSEPPDAIKIAIPIGGHTARSFSATTSSLDSRNGTPSRPP